VNLFFIQLDEKKIQKEKAELNIIKMQQENAVIPSCD